MTGSIALDVVIGLVFIYLLYSLFATIVCEIVAVHLGLRERNLKQAIRRMLEDFPETSENKFVAFWKHIKRTVSELFDNYMGPATCVFYHLPLIKYFARNTLQSKPAYITSQNFSKAILEIFRQYGGSDELSDIEKIQNVLKGNVQHTKELASLKDIIKTNPDTKEPYQPSEERDYNAIYKSLKERAESIDVNHSDLDAAQRIVLRRILQLLKAARKHPEKKAVIYRADEMLNLFGRETRTHLTSLLRDSNNDLFKFRLQLEQWFEDTMNRASGWYKQRIQFTLLIIGLIIAIGFNADTLAIVGKLSVNKDLRDKMVENASRTVNDPRTKQLIESIRKGRADSATAQKANDEAKMDSLDAVRREIQRQLDDANSLLGSGWITLPESLTLMPWTKELEARMKELKEKKLTDYAILYAIDSVYGERRLHTSDKKILEFPSGATPSILCCLKTSKVDGRMVYTGISNDGTKIDVNDTFGGYCLYILSNIFSVAFWGYLLTAIAISLGAPFWFDLLSKLIQVRGAVKTPTHTTAASSTPEDMGLSHPAHPLNRKG
ncbi:hypothetical protein [Dawidia soli]|uniref:Uncharacterized protein n=1 Tax=Dawidia soli TaxID=2782352 RepID=A0AAP2DDG1_9BACT|nr:hypothetical protein [Dawidia soli]MBT1688725.1 hypothetical protein [Dawidia soli]